MIIQRVEQADWLSNAYLVVDEPGGHGVLIDSNGVTDPLTERVEREGIELTHLLLTHQHWDHVVGATKLAERLGVPIVGSEETKAAGGDQYEVTETVGGGDVIESGGLRIEAIEVPGHVAGQLAFLIDGTDVVTADCLFKGTVGGTRAPAATGFADQRESIMDRLMELPHETRVHPGHVGPTTIGDEWEQNGFIRIWRGEDEEGTDTCEVGPPDGERQEATLILWAPDYDGGNKAWVRFADGEDAIVGGSQVKRS
jgi:glyoxylase-like metal-dependent hydrolase (beta-lactamase superfamily II)